MSILTDLTQIEKSLGILYSFGAADDEMTMDEARHLVALLQVDIAGHVEAIRDDVEHSEDMDLAAMRARADLTEAQQEIQRMTRRIDAALAALDEAGSEAITTSVKINDPTLNGHIGRAACRIGAAMRALRGQDEVVELRIGRA